KLKKGGDTLAVHEVGHNPLPTFVLIRGNAATPAKQIEPRFARVLCPTDEQAAPKLSKPADTAMTTGRRRVLAEWIAHRDNPLTARVIVNRLWQHHFGKWLVATHGE